MQIIILWKVRFRETEMPEPKCITFFWSTTLRRFNETTGLWRRAIQGRGVPRILPGGMHIFGWPTPPPRIWIWIWIRIRIRIKILSWIRIRIRIKTMRIYSPGLDCQKQCSGSMTFWGGSGPGSADPCLWLMDPDPAIFVIDLQDASKKLIFNTFFLLITFWRYIYIIFQR